MVTRIISAVVGIAVAIGILFLSATPVFNLAVSAITCLLIYEIIIGTIYIINIVILIIHNYSPFLP